MISDRYELSFDNLPRYSYAYIPADSAPDDGWPLVIALHGGGSTPESMQHFSQLIPAADRHQFALLLPAGTGPNAEFLTWNAGRCCGHAARRQVDDVGFLNHLLDDALARWPIDPQRVYVTGISNGGMMAYRAAADLSHRVAAIAPVAGALVYDPLPLTRPVPAIHLHGTQDDFVPYEGGRGARSLRRVDFPSVADSLARWQAACGYQAAVMEAAETLFSGPQQTEQEDWIPQADQHLIVTRRVHARSEGLDTIVEITIVGGGHTWPGVAPPLPFMGPTVMSVAANDLIWAFFRQFRLFN